MSQPAGRARELVKRVVRSHTRNGTGAFIPQESRGQPALPGLDRFELCERIPLTDEGRNVLPHTLRNVAIKDNIVTSTTSTTCASETLRQYRSPFDAGVVEALHEGLGTVIGKTNLDEFGMGSHSTHSIFGPVKNVAPFDKVSVGGSSGGSAVAVATEQCGFALGTDTGGSVRLPAAYTGTTGFKPSYGQVSRFGVVPYANSLDTVGIIAASTKEIMHGYDCIARPDSRDPTSFTQDTRNRLKAHGVSSKKRHRRRRIAADLWDSSMEGNGVFTNVTIGVPAEYNINEIEDGVREVWETTLDLFQNNGATLVPISLPNTKHALSAYYVIAPAEAASNLSKYDGVRYGTRSKSGGHVLYAGTRGDKLGAEAQQRILLGSYTLCSEARDNYFLTAQKVRRLVQRDFDRVFAMRNPLLPDQQFDLGDLDEAIPMEDKLGPFEVDFVVCPTAPTTAPLLKQVAKESSVQTYMNDVLTVPASLAGLPALSVPFSVSRQYRKEDHPNYAGMQVIGQVGDDQRVLSIGEKLEALRDERQLFRPPMSQHVATSGGLIDTLRVLYGAVKDPDNLVRRAGAPLSERQENELGMQVPRVKMDRFAIRPVPTSTPQQRDFKDSLEIWEQIKRSENETSISEQHKPTP